MDPTPTPTPTGIPIIMTSVEQWFVELRRVWADPGLSVGEKIWRTLTDPGVILAIFVLVVVIALIGTKLATKLKGRGSGDELSAAAETSTSPPMSTEI